MAEMRGLAELLDNLEAVKVTGVSACRGATNAAAQTVKRRAVDLARAQGLVETGTLIKNIAVARERSTPREYFECHIGVRHGRGAKGASKVAVRGKDGSIRFEYTDDPFYWWFWEAGHYSVFFRARVAPRPFLRPALDSTAPQLLDVMKDYLVARLDRVVSGSLRGLT